MVPENTPGLMPTLVKLFGSAIKIVGTDLVATTKWVKNQLKADPKFKTFWNKIDNALYRKAAMQAMSERPAASGQAGLFDSPEQATEAVQRGLFDDAPAAPAAPAAPKVAMIKGRPYDAKRDNFKAPEPSEIFSAELLAQADGFVEQYFKASEPYAMSDDDRAAGERLLAPRVKLAQEAKTDYDQKIIDIAQRTGALGQMLAPIKGMKRSVEKMHQEAQAENHEMRAEDIKDLLRSTIVVSAYADADAVIQAIQADFQVLRVKDRRGSEARAKQGGYGDVLINVV